MLAQVSRTASCAVIRQTSLRAPVGPSPPHGWVSFLTYPTNSSRQSVGSLARVYASDTQWNRELKRQIISSANKIQFRYDVDSHKSLTEAIVDEAEKAIGMGDAVLQLIVSEGLLSRYSSASIGDLSMMRSAMVDRNSCFRYAKQMRLQQFLVVGNAIDKSYSSDLSARTYTHNMMAELFEAVLGAIYVDTNLAESHIWFAKQIEWPRNFQAAVNRFIKNYK